MRAGSVLAWSAVSALAVIAALGPAAPSLARQDPGVATPEPAPNPVQEMREEEGLDPGLSTIEEPPAARQDGPVTRMEGAGEFRPVPQDGSDGASGLSEAERLAAAAEAAERARQARDNELPRLIGPSIPIVPLDLLFPPELVASINEVVVRETRGSQVRVAVMNRDTGTTERVVIQKGGSVTVGQLSIKATACFKSAPEDPLEYWAYLEVNDMGKPAPQRLAVLPQRDRAKQREARGPRLLRRGWMIASSPAVTPVDHPVYDVWVVACEGEAGGPTPVASLEALQRLQQGGAQPTAVPETPPPPPARP